MKTGAEEMVEPTRKGSETGPDIGAGALHRVPVASQDDEGGRAATEEPTRIVVYVIDGTIQCVLATKEVETYVVEHDLRNDHGKHGFNTEIGGLPVMLSRRKNLVAPRLVGRVVRAHRRARSRVESEETRLTASSEGGWKG